MARDPVPTWTFVLAVVRRDERFLLIQEVKDGQTWYLPAGRVEPHERLVEAVRRETLEEAGIPIVVDGVLRVERVVKPTGVRVRVIFAAHPADDTPPKSVPDRESLGAGWFTLAEAARLPLRGDDVLESLQLGPVYPLDVLSER